MAEKYVEKIKSASSGEIYTIRDPQTANKQDLLVSGTNIKTVNNQSLLGSGNITIEGGGGTDDYESLNNLPAIDGNTLHASSTAAGLGLATTTDLATKANASDLATKANASDLTAHTGNSDIHVTTSDKTTWSGKQDALVSGTNIKTINNQSILGEGNISIGGSGGTSDYNQLDHRPSIEGVTLTEGKTAAELNLRTLIGKVDTEYYEDHGTLKGYRTICPGGHAPAEGSTVPAPTATTSDIYRTTPELVLAPGESIEVYTTAATVGRAWGRYKESDRTVIDYAEGNANYLTTPWTWTNTYDYNIIVVCCFDSSRVSGDLSKFQVTVTHLESTTPTINNVAVEGHLTGSDLHLAADNYGSGNAGKALYVDSDGSIVPQTVSIPSQQIDDAVEDYLDNNPDIPRTVVTATTVYNSESASETGVIVFTPNKYYTICASNVWQDPARTSLGSLSGCLAIQFWLNEGDKVDYAYLKGGSNARAFAVYDADNGNALMYDTDTGNVIGAGTGGTGINDYTTTPWTYTAPKHVMVLAHCYDSNYATKFSLSITRRVDNDPKINNVPMKFGQNVTGADLGLVDKSYVDGRLNDVYTEAIFPATYEDNPDLTTGSYFTEYYINAAGTSIGSIFSAPKSHLAGFWCFQDIFLKKGDKVTLYNKGGSNGRGWWYCDAKEHRLLARAESGENHLTTPFVFTADRDLWFGGTCSTKYLSLTIERAVSKDGERIVQLQVQADSNTERLDAIDGGSVGPSNWVAKTNNPRMDWNKQQIRILDIGNSFSQNTYKYITEITQNLGVDTSNILFATAQMGGSSYRDWYECYTDQKDKSYSVSKKFGGIDESFPGTADNLNGEKFRRALAEHDWDLILIHQVSSYSNDYTRWEDHDAAGYLKELVRLIRWSAPRASLGFLMVHAGPSNNPNTTERWGQIAESAAWMKMQYGVEVVVPVGTAVQGIRQSVVAANATHQMTIDNSHQAPGLSEYTSGLTAWEALFAPIFHKSCWDCTYYPAAGGTPSAGYENDYIDVTPENAVLAKKAAITAVHDMFTLHNPDDIVFPMPVEESSSL